MGRGLVVEQQTRAVDREQSERGSQYRKSIYVSIEGQIHLTK